MFDRRLKIGFGVTLLMLAVLIFVLYSIFSTEKSVTVKDDAKTHTSIKVEKVKLSSNIEDVSSGRKKEFLLQLENKTSKYAQLSFLNEKEFSYEITTSDGKTVVKQGVGKKLSTPKKERIDPKSTYDISIDVTKDYNKLKDGNYLIQAETSAKEAEKMVVGISFLKEPASQVKFETKDYTFGKMDGKNKFTAVLKGTKEEVKFKADDSLAVMVKRLKKGNAISLTYELAPDTNVLRAFEKK